MKKSYITPFKDAKYNKLFETKKYIDKIKDDNIFKNKQEKNIIDHAPDINTLIDISNHIIELTATNVAYANTAKTIVSVDLECDKIYKGGEFENINSILLPAGIKEGKAYLIFLINNEESVTLAARNGSVIETGTIEYKEALSIIDK